MGRSDLNADETAAATGVGQQVLLVAGADEGGIPPHLTDGAAVGFAQVGNRFLQQMLQEALLVDVDLIELIDVDEQKASQTALRFLPTLEVDAVRIAETQLRWQQNAAKVDFRNPWEPTSRGEVLFPCCRSIPRQCATMPRNQR